MFGTKSLLKPNEIKMPKKSCPMLTTCHWPISYLRIYMGKPKHWSEKGWEWMLKDENNG